MMVYNDLVSNVARAFNIDRAYAATLFTPETPVEAIEAILSYPEIGALRSDLFEQIFKHARSRENVMTMLTDAKSFEAFGVPIGEPLPTGFVPKGPWWQSKRNPLQ